MKPTKRKTVITVCAKFTVRQGVFVRPLCVFCLVRVIQWRQKELFYLPHLEYRIWKIQHDSKSLVHVSMVTEYSLSWLSRAREGLVLFMVIHNLVRSWICGSGAEGVCLCRSLLSSQALISETDTCRVSWRPRPHTPPQSQGKGRSEGGGTETELPVYRLLMDWRKYDEKVKLAKRENLDVKQLIVLLWLVR